MKFDFLDLYHEDFSLFEFDKKKLVFDFFYL